MPKPGPKPKVSDDRLLLELLLINEPKIMAGQVEPRIDLDIQQTRDRLNKLSDETEYVEKRRMSGRNMYDLTDAGRLKMMEILRDCVD